MTPLTRTPISWSPPADMSFEAWQEAFDSLMVAHDSLPWLIGDCLNAGERVFGEDYAQALPETRKAQEMLRGYMWVASRVPTVARATALSWSHHRAVAGLEGPEQTRWLERAQAEGLTVKALKDALRPALVASEGEAGEGDPDSEEPQAEVLAPKARPTVEYHDADEDQLESLKRAWNRAGSEVRESFLTWTQDNERPVFDNGQADPHMPKFLRRGVVQ